MLGRAVSFAVPVVEHCGVWRGRSFMAYRRIDGRPLQAADRLELVAPLLGELHTFPIERAAALLGCEAGRTAWRERYDELRADIDAQVLPLLDRDLRKALLAAYDRFMAELETFRPSLVHADLGTEHILVDQDTRAPIGLIDFETAMIGDPAVDFVGLLLTLGAPATRRILDAYPGAISWDRLLFYGQVAPAYDVVYGLAQDDSSIVKGGIDGLRERLLAVPGDLL